MQKFRRGIIFGVILASILIISSATLVPQIGSAQVLKTVKKVEQTKKLAKPSNFTLKVDKVSKKDLKALASILKKIIESESFKKQVKDFLKSRESRNFINSCKSLFDEKCRYKIGYENHYNFLTVLRNLVEKNPRDNECRDLIVDLGSKGFIVNNLLEEIHFSGLDFDPFFTILILLIITTVISIITWPVAGVIWAVYLLFDEWQAWCNGYYESYLEYILNCILAVIEGFVLAPYLTFLWLWIVVILKLPGSGW